MQLFKLTTTSFAVLIIFSFCSCGLELNENKKTTLMNKNVEITNLKDKDYVLWRDLVEGNSSATEESGLKAYVLVWPIEGSGPWYVQTTTTFPDGSFRSKAFFGGDPAQYPDDIGTTYRIVAIITNETLESGKFENLTEIPESNRSKEVIVIRDQ